MERVKWTDKIKDAVVLERVGEGRIMLELIRKRKRNWLGLLTKKKLPPEGCSRRYGKWEESSRQKKISEEGRVENAEFAVKDLPLGRKLLYIYIYIYIYIVFRNYSFKLIQEVKKHQNKYNSLWYIWSLTEISDARDDLLRR